MYQTETQQLWGSFGVIYKNRRIILQQRNDPNPEFHKKWAMPGGIIQFGEHPEETLVRRCWQEIGIKIEIMKIIPEIQSYVVEDKQLLLIHYLAITKDESLRNLDDQGDILDVKWVDIKDIGKYKLLRGTASVIKLALSSR